MNKPLKGALLGLSAGIIDLIPMILQNLSWDANLSALSLWIISGFLISTSNIKINSVLKGIIISLLVLIPSAFLIGWSNPLNLLPIIMITLVLGGILGYIINRLK